MSQHANGEAESCLLDRIPKIGQFRVENHWTAQEIISVAQAVASLGQRLAIERVVIEDCRKRNDVKATRGGVSWGLVSLQETLLPILGADPLWVLSQATFAMEAATASKRHWLTALPSDNVTVRQDAPENLMMQAVAAAILDYAASERPGWSTQAAQQIADAFGNGGMRKPSARTVQDWRSQLVAPVKSGKRRRADDQKTRLSSPTPRKFFVAMCDKIKTGAEARDQTFEQFFATLLGDLTQRVREYAGMFASSRDSITSAKSAP